MHEVEIIAHSCGVPEPRLLDRRHARVINPQGLPVPLSEVYISPQSSNGSNTRAIH
jgi:hypothetical protein